MLSLNNIHKTYKIIKRRKGLSGIFKDMFVPKYKKINALNNISLNISSEEKIAVIGKNGSGKSTLIKVLACIIKPTKGKFLVYNKDPYKNIKQYKKQMGIIFGQRSQLLWELAFQESLELSRLIYGVDKAEFEKQKRYLTEGLDINELLTHSIREMSLGQRMKCELALILLHKPKLVLLDEPTIGLDLEVKERLYIFLKDYLKKQKATLILTSHHTTDIEKLTDRIILLDNGECIKDCSVEEFISLANIEKKVIIDFNPFKSFPINRKNTEIKILYEENHKVEFKVPYSWNIYNITNLINKDAEIYDVEITEEDFSSILLRFYKEKKLVR